MVKLHPSKVKRGSVPTSLILAVAVVAAASSAVAVKNTNSMHNASTFRQIAPVDPICTSASPCTDYQNNGAGFGLEGISKGAAGLYGQTLFNSVSASNFRDGVGGLDASTSGTFNSGVEGKSTRGTGVFGVSMSGAGVVGQSLQGNGIVGQTSQADTTGTPAPAGILGEDLSTPNPKATNFTAGVGGTSVSGSGVVGVAGLFNPRSLGGSAPVYIAGVQGSSFYPSNPGNFGALGLTTGFLGTEHNMSVEGGFGAYGNGYIGVEGVGANYLSTGPATGTGVAGYGSIGVFADDPFGQLEYPGYGFALYVEQDNTPANSDASVADVMVGAGPGGNKVMSLDTSGNMILSGSLTENGSPMVVQKTVGGRNVATYPTRATSPVVEDFGEGTLIDGRGNVRLDPSFIATIDQRTMYLVFLNPDGMVHGTLCVMEKTSAGFTVQESQGGRSTIAFDYRVVAKPYGDNSQRLGSPRLISPIKVQLPKAYIPAPNRVSPSSRFSTGRLP